MNKREKFLAIIDFLEKLDDNKFLYSKFVSKWNNKSCGTVCCVAGWLPSIFPEYFKWDESKMTDVSGINCNRETFLDLSEFDDMALFFGCEENQLLLELPITDIDSKLPAVIHLFKTYVKKYVPERSNSNE